MPHYLQRLEDQNDILRTRIDDMSDISDSDSSELKPRSPIEVQVVDRLLERLKCDASFN